MTTRARSLNDRAKRWPGWALLAVVVVGLLAVGIARDRGPRTTDERIVALEKRLACPVCDGESVYVSRNSASIQIRERIRQEVEAGRLDDQQIIDTIVVAYADSEELLIPTASGVESLAWALPAAALVIGCAGLTVAFRRWRDAARRLGAATDDDYALVERAMSSEATDAGDADADADADAPQRRPAGPVHES